MPGIDGAKASGGLAPIAAILLSSLFWGSLWYPLRRIDEAGVHGIWGSALAYGLPALPFMPWAVRRWRHWLASGWALPLAGLAMAACNLLFAAGVLVGEVSTVILLFYLNPVWTTALEWLLWRNRIAPVRWMAILLALGGLGVLHGSAPDRRLFADGGAWLGLSAGLCWAVALLALRSARGRSVWAIAFAQFIATFPVGLLLLLGLGQFASPPAAAALSAALPWMIATAFLWLLPGMALAIWGAARLSPGRASMLFCSEVVVGVLTAAWLAGEALTWQKCLGGAMILAASLVDGLTALSRREEMA